MGSRSRDAKTALVRLSFTDSLFKPQKTQSGKEQYGCSIHYQKGQPLAAALMDKTAITLQELALEAAKEEWGDKAVQMLKDGLIHNPFLDGDGPQGKNKKNGDPHKGFPGTVFIRCISGVDYPPKLVKKNGQVGATKDEIYSGVYGYAVVNAFTWENKEKGKGISFGISMVQCVKDGEKLGGGGGADVDAWAEAIPDEGEAPAETKGGAGAAGLFA